MARPPIVGFMVVIFATYSGAASAQHSVLVLHPDETRTFDAAHRGDTVSCEGLRLTVQRTPTHAHISGVALQRLMYRQVYSAGLVLSVAAPLQHLVIATCKRR